jgi:hypothetical protein
MRRIFFLIPLLFLICLPTQTTHAQQNIQTNDPADIPTTTGVVLKITPASITQQIGEAMEFTVSLAPGSFSIKALDLALTYDKDAFEILDILPTELTKSMTEINKLIDNDTGTTLYSLGVPVNNPDETLVKETGAIATITAKVKKAGDTTLEINRDKTIIAAKNQDKNILFSAENATITGEGEDETTASIEEQPSTAATMNANLIPMIIAGVMFCLGLLIFVFVFLRKPKAE